MKNIAAALLVLLTSTLISSCSSPVPTSPAYASSDGIAAPSPTSAPGQNTTTLDNLKAGILPDSAASSEEQKLANLLTRKVNIEFPLKVGVLLYRESTTLDDKNRKTLYNNFITNLKNNPDISSVQEISPSLVGSNTNIEDLRKLAARFQVSTLLIINDIYQSTRENKDIAVTPIDVISGNKNWESFTNIEIFALDILNGVFVASSSINASAGDKYNKDNPTKNKDEQLARESANKAWEMLNDKVKEQITVFKNQQATSTIPQASAVPSVNQ